MAHSGALGQIVSIRTWHTFTVEDPSSNIRYKASLDGGALNDCGCYCVAGSLLALGESATSCVARQRLCSSGVDEATYGVLGFPDSATAVFDCSLRAPEGAGLHLVGTEGQIEVPQPWFPHLEPHFWLVDLEGQRRLVDCPGPNSYMLEVENFCQAIAGRSEPAVGRELTRGVAEVLALVPAVADRIP
jgi:predicted dehydrogenase